MQRLVLSSTFILLILLAEISSGQDTDDGIQPLHPLGKIRGGKVLMAITMDYDYGGANPKHDPGRKSKGGGGSSGGGGKNP